MARSSTGESEGADRYIGREEDIRGRGNFNSEHVSSDAVTSQVFFKHDSCFFSLFCFSFPPSAFCFVFPLLVTGQAAAV